MPLPALAAAARAALGAQNAKTRIQAGKMAANHMRGGGSQAQNETVNDGFFAMWALITLIVEVACAVISTIFSFFFINAPIGAIVNPFVMWLFYLNPDTHHWDFLKKFSLSIGFMGLELVPVLNLFPTTTVQVIMTWFDAHNQKK